MGAADLAKLKNGMQVTITPTGATQPIFGTVSTVGVIGTTSGGTSTFPVTIAVTGVPDRRVRRYDGERRHHRQAGPDVLTVPTSAIHEENGQTVVYQMRNGAQVSTPVTVGTVYGTTTQITKGLNAGDEVVVTSARGSDLDGQRNRRTGTTRRGRAGSAGFGGTSRVAARRRGLPGRRGCPGGLPGGGS